MDPKELNQHLFSLISMFASACWQQMGKIPSQMDGKIHRDLKSAQVTIDMLLMLKDKTKGNLTKTEVKPKVEDKKEEVKTEEKKN